MHYLSSVNLTGLYRLTATTYAYMLIVLMNQVFFKPMHSMRATFSAEIELSVFWDSPQKEGSLPLSKQNRISIIWQFSRPCLPPLFTFLFTNFWNVWRVYTAISSPHLACFTFCFLFFPHDTDLCPTLCTGESNYTERGRGMFEISTNISCLLKTFRLNKGTNGPRTGKRWHYVLASSLQPVLRLNSQTCYVSKRGINHCGSLQTPKISWFKICPSQQSNFKQFPYAVIL